jgi:hypothetical protein
MDRIHLAKDRDTWQALTNIEDTGSRKCGEFLDSLRNSLLLKNDHVLWIYFCSISQPFASCVSPVILSLPYFQCGKNCFPSIKTGVFRFIHS